MRTAAAKTRLVPKLRFSGFEDNWKRTTLGELLDYEQPTRYIVNSTEYNDSYDTPVLTAGKTFILGHTNETNGLFKENLPVIIFDDFTTASQFVTFPFKVKSSAIKILLPKPGASIKFAHELLKRIEFSAKDHKRHWIGTFQNFKVLAPNKDEQQRVAGFLAAVDDKIAALQQKVDLLKKYKKGTAQAIFTQRLRFKNNGTDYPAWEKKELSKIAGRVTERNRDAKSKTVLTNSAERGIIGQQEYFEKDIANQNNLTNYHVVSTNDFVYNPRISSLAPVGPIKRNHLAVGVMSPLYTVFRFTHGNADFFEAYFSTSLWHDYLRSIANSGARHDRMNITTSDFYKMPMPFPCLEEQQKIANFLTAIDDKINLTKKELEQAQRFKKALLQQMFV